MSASLVGSEMCIRDRLRRCLAQGDARMSFRRFARRGSDGSRFARFSKSVSYTHLTLPTICSV
eukprot:7569434-Alexandrium_andersonii.AAC.1